MSANRLELSFFYKIVILFYNEFLIWALFFLFPLIWVDIDFKLFQFIDMTFLTLQVHVAIIFLFMWIIDSIKIMSILNSFYIDSAKKISDIVLPFSDKTRKTLLILTLKLDSGSKNKRFYFVRKNIAESDVDYEVLVSISNPDKYILISSLPKFIRSHLNKY